tara:strand:- start:826 stop:1356 length:531 start_codon:yes stop_codon:yes gene_type:complete
MKEFKINKKLLGNTELIYKKKKDFRGYLSRIFCNIEFSKIKKNISIKQINFTYTKKAGTIRGMHYQSKPFEEDKIVLCIKGKVYDVALNVQKSSKNYLKFNCTILSEKNNKIHFIPKGFAHGYQSLTDNCELIYLHSNIYSKIHSKYICPIQNKFKINWPIKNITISKKDASGKKF